MKIIKFIFGLIVVGTLFLVGMSLLQDIQIDENDLAYYRSKEDFVVYRFENLPSITQEIRGEGIYNGIGGGNYKSKFDNNELEVYCRLRQNGFNRLSAAGIMGNIQAESNFRPDAIEAKKTEPKGYGLFQLTNEPSSPYAGRSTDNRNYVAKSGAKYPSIESQIEYFDWEIHNRPRDTGWKTYYHFNGPIYQKVNAPKYNGFYDKSINSWDEFKKYNGSVETATFAFMVTFERPNHYDKTNHLTTRRIPNAKKYFEKYATEESKCYENKVGSSATNNSLRAKIVSIARQQIGKPYIWGDEGPNGFDCSGLVHYSYKQNGFQWERRHSTRDYITAKYYKEIPCEQAQPGDLVLTNPGISHVVMITTKYGSDGSYIHAPAQGQTVREDKGIPYSKEKIKCVNILD